MRILGFTAIKLVYLKSTVINSKTWRNKILPYFFTQSVLMEQEWIKKEQWASITSIQTYSTSVLKKFRRKNDSEEHTIILSYSNRLFMVFLAYKSKCSSPTTCFLFNWSKLIWHISSSWKNVGFFSLTGLPKSRMSCLAP